MLFTINFKGDVATSTDQKQTHSLIKQCKTKFTTIIRLKTCISMQVFFILCLFFRRDLARPIGSSKTARSFWVWVFRTKYAYVTPQSSFFASGNPYRVRVHVFPKGSLKLLAILGSGSTLISLSPKKGCR